MIIIYTLLLWNEDRGHIDTQLVYPKYEKKTILIYVCFIWLQCMKCVTQQHIDSHPKLWEALSYSTFTLFGFYNIGINT